MIQRRNPLVIAGLCCILCPSLGMLAATYYNRSGQPVGILQLTQRELRLPADDADPGENSALTFGLIWRVEGMGHSDIVTQPPSLTPVPWMTAQKSAELGVRSDADLRWRSSVPAYLVLEFNGPTYARELAQACRNGSDICERVRNRESRLYVVDAGTNARVLRSEYPDTAVYAVVHGVVSFASAPETGQPATTIGGLDVGTVQAIEPLRSGRTWPSGEMRWHAFRGGKSFVAQIAFGQRNEPWNQSVSFGPHSDPPPADSPVYREDGRVDINSR